MHVSIFLLLLLIIIVIIIIIITIIIIIITIIIISLFEVKILKYVKFICKFELIKDEAWFLQHKPALSTPNLKSD